MPCGAAPAAQGEQPARRRSGGPRSGGPRSGGPRAGAARALGLGGLAVLALSGGFAVLGGFRPVVSLGALLPYGVIAAIVLARVEATHPHARFGLPNQITLLRAVLNCVLIGLLADPARLAAEWTAWLGWLFIGTALVSLSLDGVDGFVARRRGLGSRFGARFDIEIDALLLLLLAAAALATGKAGPWVLAIGGLYYAFQAAGLAWPWLRRALPPSWRRKTVFVIQAVALLVLTVPGIVPPASTAIAATALLALVCSFATDIAWLRVRRRGKGAGPADP